MKTRTFYCLCLLLVASASALRAQQTNYPADARVGWVNVKSYGAKGDGVTDDTRAIQRAVTTYPRQYHSRIILYFPDGEYVVSDTIKYLGGYYDGWVTLQGQSTPGTVIRLKNNAPGYGDPANPKPLIYVTRAGNQSFNQYIFNLTIHTGSGNPGAVALDYVTNNLGAVKNVHIASGDGAGYCGLRMERTWPGPGLIKNVSISGYQYGIRLAYREFGMTFENITLRNQSVAGLVNYGNEAAIRKLTSVNAVPAVISTNPGQSGQLVLLDGNFSGGNPGEAAIVSNGFVYLRNITASGYATALKHNNTPVDGLSVTEYSSEQPKSLFPYQGSLSLNLPVRETPEYDNNDTTQWANVQDYGARPTNLMYGFYDATEGLRRAFRSGKAVIYFPPVGDNGSAYHIYDTISIPATVKLIIGFDHANAIEEHNQAQLLVKENGADPLIFERIGVGTVKNLSPRTVVFKHLGMNNYDNGPNSGDLFLEDVVGRVVPSYPMNMWARQLNTEVQAEGDINVLNQGGNYWILGQKTEGRAVVNKTINGGRSEILGGLLYPTQTFADANTAALISEDACISAIFSQSSYVSGGVSNGFYPVFAAEKRGSEVRKLGVDSVNWGAALYRGGCNESPTANGVTYEYWTGIGGYEVADIPVNTPPTGTRILTSLEGPSDWNNDYGARIRGYITAPVSGAYTFYLATDDKGAFWLSTNDDPVNRARVAHIDGWTRPREWAKYPTQRSASIGLVAGQRYYFEAYQKEANGGDNLAVGWTYPDQVAIQVVPGNYLSPYLPLAAARTAPEAQLPRSASAFGPLYPNPAVHTTTVSYRAVAAGTIQVVVRDLLGRVIYTAATSVKTGENAIALHLEKAGSGSYLVTATAKEGRQTYRLVIAK